MSTILPVITPLITPVVHHADVPRQPFPGGATYQTLVGDAAGSTPVRIGIQESPPGYATPVHSHPYLEVLTVLEGAGEAWLDGEAGPIRMAPGVTLVLPPDRPHWFRVTGEGTLKTYGVHASPTRIVQHREAPAVSTETLAAFGDAWNRHDVEAIMGYMADDCVFETTAGPEPCGKRYAGRARVRDAFARVFAMFPDAHFGDARHLVSGERGLSEWRFTGTRDGQRLEVDGCDVFTFRDGRIAVKSSYFKNRLP